MRKTYYTGPRNGELKAALQLLFNNLSDNVGTQSDMDS